MTKVKKILESVPQTVNENAGRIFTIKTFKSVILKNLIEVVKPYLKECNIRITPDYFKISTMDIAKKSITFIKLDAPNFESYYCKSSKTIGIEVITLYKAIKSATKRDTITLYINEDEPDKLCIELVDPVQGKYKKYKMQLLDLENERIVDIQDIEFDYTINLPSIEFQKIIKDIHLLEGKIVEIKSIDKELIFSCNDGIAEFKTSLTEPNDNLTKEQRFLLQENGEDLKSVCFEKVSDVIVQGRFKMTYLMYFIKASHISESMSILLANDKPLVLKYNVSDMGRLDLLLMPETNL
jgi:proliferating cell nuclear antigen PCNA